MGEPPPPPPPDEPSSYSAGEWVATSAGLGLVVLYHVCLIFLAWKLPKRVAFAGTSELRLQWLRSVVGFSAESSDVASATLAIQTLRNAIMSASFFATITTTVGFLLLSVGLTSGGGVFSNLAGGGDSDSSQSFAVFRVLCVTMALFLSSLSFAATVRSYNHLSFLAATRPMGDAGRRRWERIEERAGVHQTVLPPCLLSNKPRLGDPEKGASGTDDAAESTHEVRDQLSQRKKKKRRAKREGSKSKRAVKRDKRDSGSCSSSSSSDEAQAIELTRSNESTAVSESQPLIAVAAEGLSAEELLVVENASADDLLATFLIQCRHARRSAIFWTLGVRFFYLSIVFSFWLAGPYYLLVASIILTGIMAYADLETG